MAQLEDEVFNALGTSALSLAVRVLCGFVLVVLLVRKLQQRLAKRSKRAHSDAGLPSKPR